MTQHKFFSFNIKTILLGVLMGLVLLVMNNNQVVMAAAGDYPQGTMAFDGKADRSINVTPGTAIPYTVKISKAQKVCQIFIMTIGGNQRGKRTIIKHPRGTESASYTGSVDTTGWTPGTYHIFMYAETNCITDGYGLEDNGFVCDGNPTCLTYCGKGTAREKLGDISGKPYEPGDLYQTSANPAYAIGGQNSCGSPNTAEDNKQRYQKGPDQNSYRVGECEAVSCDSSGKNLDNLIINIGSGAASGTGSTATGSTATGSTAGGGANVSTNVVLAATANTKGQVSAPSNTLTGSNIDVTAGVSTADSSGLVLGGVAQPLNKYTGGSLTTQDLSPGVTLSNAYTVTVAKGVKIKSAVGGGMTLSNPAMSNISVFIPDGTNVLSSSAWDGNLKTPTAVSGDLTAAAQGFQINDTKFGLGSDKASLLFDNPITITLTGVTGTIAYKSPESNKLQPITTVCGGSYTSPTPPAFPLECYKTDDNQKNTKIVTYHMTDFAVISAPPVASYLSSGPGLCTVADDPSRAALKVEWGTSSVYTSYAIARTECASFNVCNGTEQSLTSSFIPNKTDTSLTFTDPTVTSGKYYRYRVWGLLLGLPSPIGLPKSWDPLYWSQQIIIQANCNGSNKGLSLQQFQVTVPTAAPAATNAAH